MYLAHSKIFNQKSSAFNHETNYFDVSMKRALIYLLNPLNFSSQEEEVNSLSDDTSSNSSFSLKDPFDSSQSLEEKDDSSNDPSYSSLYFMESTNEKEKEKEKEKKPFFKVAYPKKDSLFDSGENNNSVSASKEETEKTFLLRKRFSYRRPRKENQDNIRKKIKLGFFNVALINLLNEKLKTIGSSSYLRKFPQNFISDVTKERNKELFLKTLRDVFVTKGLYKCEPENGLSNYYHNLNVVLNEDDEEFKKILDKKIKDLYNEYINSDVFKIGEINRLKKKKMDDDYIARYIHLAKHLCEFLCL